MCLLRMIYVELTNSNIMLSLLSFWNIEKKNDKNVDFLTFESQENWYGSLKVNSSWKFNTIFEFRLFASSPFHQQTNCQTLCLLNFHDGFSLVNIYFLSNFRKEFKNILSWNCCLDCCNTTFCKIDNESNGIRCYIRMAGTL